MLIVNFFGRLDFREIGNTFYKFLFSSESRADSRLRLRFIQVVLRIVLGHTVRRNSIEEFTVPWIYLKACGGQNFQIGVLN